MWLVDSKRVEGNRREKKGRKRHDSDQRHCFFALVRCLSERFFSCGYQKI